MVYRAPDAQTFLLGRSWRSYCDTAVALSGAATGVFALALPKLFVPITLVTTGYGLARLYSGVPRSLEIDGSVMRLRFWARRVVVLTLGTTQVSCCPTRSCWCRPTPRTLFSAAIF